MKQEVLDYVKTQKVGVLAVEMPDGSPHASTVHFAHTDAPFVFLFETYREYRKAEALLHKPKIRASFVLGCDESTKITLQLDGVAQLLSAEEKEMFDSVYIGKFPNKAEKSKDPKFLSFKFTPTRWKFTDWSVPSQKKVLESK